MESDSEVAVGFLLTKGCPITHPFAPMVSKIRELCARSWEVRLSHVWREGNCIADYLLLIHWSLASTSLDILRRGVGNCGSRMLLGHHGPGLVCFVVVFGVLNPPYYKKKKKEVRVLLKVLKLSWDFRMTT